MLATASQSPVLVRVLLDAPAWARKFQYEPVLSQIEKTSSEMDVPQLAPVAFERAGARNIREAGERSVALMQKTTARFLRERGCVSCHAQESRGGCFAADPV